MVTLPDDEAMFTPGVRRFPPYFVSHRSDLIGAGFRSGTLSPEVWVEKVTFPILANRISLTLFVTRMGRKILFFASFLYSLKTPS